jgi:hypothetical protein
MHFSTLQLFPYSDNFPIWYPALFQSLITAFLYYLYHAINFPFINTW